jgi:hypothetical protein
VLLSLFYFNVDFDNYFRAKEEERMGGLHQAFKDAQLTLRMKTPLHKLFHILDPMHGKEWPQGFAAFLNTKAEIPENSAKAKKLRDKGGFSEDNVMQLCFADKIDERGIETRRVINNFLNPNWTDDYGSGGNEEGHLLLMRCHYYRTEFVLKNAKKNVNAFITQIKKNPTRVSETYRLRATSTQQEIDTEVERIAGFDAANFDPTWYPNCWLSFYLFGKPSHGTDKCFETLQSRKPSELSGTDMAAALADLNTEAAAKEIRRKDVKRKKDAGIIDLSREATQPQTKTVIVQHNISSIQNSKADKTKRLEKALELLQSSDLPSDEETGFSKKKKIRDITMKLLNSYTYESDDDN